MRVTPYISAFLIALFTITCSNDFDTSAEWKEIAVVYGLLDQNDTAQYIIVQRAFLNREGNNLIGLQEPDSIYFTSNIQVELSEFEGGQLVQRQSLQLVNGNDEGIIKDDGLFSSKPNWLYKWSQPVNDEYNYDLNITNQTTGNSYFANTPIIQDLEIINLFINSGFNFADDSDNMISWFNSDFAAVYQLKLEIIYKERDTTLLEPITFEKKIEKLVGGEVQSVKGSSVITIDFKDEEFFSWLNQSIEVNPLVERCFSRINIILLAGSENLFNMIQSQQAQFGLTQFQVQPNFTNIEGDDALGLFASRTSTRLDSITISSGTFQAILDNPKTAGLHFLPYLCE